MKNVHDLNAAWSTTVHIIFMDIEKNETLTLCGVIVATVDREFFAGKIFHRLNFHLALFCCYDHLTT